MKFFRLGKVAAFSCGAMLGLALASLPAPARAGSAVTPTMIRLVTERDTGEVTLWNGGTTPMLVEASVVSWNQENGRDVFAPSQDFIIAPAIVEVRPGSGQIFRVRARVRGDVHEQTYRMRLEDITPAKPGDGVGMRIRHDLPLILSAPGGKADLSFSSCPDGRTGCLRAMNRGTSLARITGLSITNRGVDKQVSGLTSILAGNWHEWIIPGLTAGGSITIHAQTAQGAVDATLARP